MNEKQTPRKVRLEHLKSDRRRLD